MFGLVKKENATQIIHTVQLVKGARLLDMKFNAEGNILYVTGSNSVIYSITFSAGQQPVVKELALKCLPVAHIAVNNNQLYLGSQDGNIYISDVNIKAATLLKAAQKST